MLRIRSGSIPSFFIPSAAAVKPLCERVFFLLCVFAIRKAPRTRFFVRILSSRYEPFDQHRRCFAKQPFRRCRINEILADMLLAHDHRHPIVNGRHGIVRRPRQNDKFISAVRRLRWAVQTRKIQNPRMRQIEAIFLCRICLLACTDMRPFKKARRRDHTPPTELQMRSKRRLFCGGFRSRIDQKTSLLRCRKSPSKRKCIGSAVSPHGNHRRRFRRKHLALHRCAAVLLRAHQDLKQLPFICFHFRGIASAHIRASFVRLFLDHYTTCRTKIQVFSAISIYHAPFFVLLFCFLCILLYFIDFCENLF